VKLCHGSTMKELVLRHFFEGHATAKELSDDLEGTRQALEPAGFRSSANYQVVPMSHEFTVEAPHVIRLVDAVADGALSLELLGDLCFCMEASDRFRWDTDTANGERVAEAVFWLGTPEVNYPLNARVLSKIRQYLITGENTLEPIDLAEEI
jgi:hypothetical protein